MDDDNKVRGFFIRNTENDNDDEIKLPGRDKNPTKNDPTRPKARHRKMKNPKNRVSGMHHDDDDKDSKINPASAEQTIARLPNEEAEIDLGKAKLAEDEASGDSFSQFDIGEPTGFPTDQQLTQEIEEAIAREDSISAEAKKVHVFVDHGKATLVGEVVSEQEKMTVGDKAAACVGFGKVNNRLEIKK